LGRDLGIVSDSESGGPHTSRTIMLAELRRLLAACPPEATTEDLTGAVLEENVLAKRTEDTRRRSLRYLRELYVLDRRRAGTARSSQKSLGSRKAMSAEVTRASQRPSRGRLLGPPVGGLGPRMTRSGRHSRTEGSTASTARREFVST
jgi:hypothetical protein